SLVDLMPADERAGSAMLPKERPCQEDRGCSIHGHVEIVGPRAVAVHEAVIGGRMGALGAALSRADAAADADGHGLATARESEAVRIDHLGGALDGAAQPDREVAARRVVPVPALSNGLGDAEIALAVRHLADLDVDVARIEEGGIDVPARAGARVAGDADAREREALRDVAR